LDRISAVYNQKDDLELTIEQKTLLEETYRDFVRGGAELEEEKQKRLRDINQDLAVLSVQFGDNVLEEMNGPALVLDSEQELAGLPEQVRLNAAQTAKELGLEGKWVFTLQRTSAEAALSGLYEHGKQR
jgi:peptidyl-dipeptidase Dcp